MNYLVEATYWANGALKDETYPSVPGAGDRRIVSYTNDAAGRIGSLNSNATSYAPAASVATIGYASHNALNTETYGNSLIHAISYNNRLQPNEIKLGTSGAPTSVVDLTYNYGTTNNNGNVLSLGYSGGGLSYTQSFGYDGLNRLTTSNENSGASWSQTNSYDQYGNRSIVGGSLSFDANTNRLSGGSYDSAGNLLNDGVHTYSFDAENKIFKLRRSHVDFGLNLINVKRTKTGKDRTIPMDESVREILSGLCHELGDEDFVFENSRTGVHLTDIKHGFKSACREAEIHDLTFHDLRHTFGTRLADAGVDIVKIAELMGHQSILTTRPYTHATDEGKRAAIAHLANYRAENCHKFATREMRLVSQPTASRISA